MSARHRHAKAAVEASLAVWKSLQYTVTAYNATITDLGKRGFEALAGEVSVALDVVLEQLEVARKNLVVDVLKARNEGVESHAIREACGVLSIRSPRHASET